MLQLPATFTKPLSDDFVTDGDLLIELADIAWKSPENPEGLKLDEWQKWLLRHLLERYPDDHENPDLAGRLRYRQAVVSLGRQNGKSLLAAILGLYGLLVHQKTGAQVLSLASSSDQARIIYSRVLFVIQNNPFLAKRFKKATEQRGILTADGTGRYDVKAAKESALQGIPISLCLFDELHLAKPGMWSAAIFGTSQKTDGMVLGITTAGDAKSETLIDLYKEGHDAATGNKDLERFGFFLWTAPEGSAVTDPEAIYAANPSVAAGRIGIDQVISDLKTIPEHEARRYRLNQFIKGSAESWISHEIFARAGSKEFAPKERGVFAVDIEGNWEHATIAYANEMGGVQYSELVQTYVRPREDALFNRLVALFDKHSPRAIALDDRQLPNLGKRLKMVGIPVWQLWTKEMIAAGKVAHSLITSDEAKHNNDPLLLIQSQTAVTKHVGENWMINRRESGEVDALMATIMAIYVSSRAQNAEIGVF